MLEELSLLTNKGSKMFKLRQLRVEKFIYENNPDAFTDNSVVSWRLRLKGYSIHSGKTGMECVQALFCFNVCRQGVGRVYYQSSERRKQNYINTQVLFPFGSSISLLWQIFGITHTEAWQNSVLSDEGRLHIWQVFRTQGRANWFCTHSISSLHDGNDPSKSSRLVLFLV